MAQRALNCMMGLQGGGGGGGGVVLVSLCFVAFVEGFIQGVSPFPPFRGKLSFTGDRWLQNINSSKVTIVAANFSVQRSKHW